MSTEKMLPASIEAHLHQTQALLAKQQEEREQEQESDRVHHQIEIVDHHHHQLRSRSSTLPSSIDRIQSSHRSHRLLNKRLPFTDLHSPGIYSNSFSFQQDPSSLDLELDQNHPHPLEHQEEEEEEAEEEEEEEEEQQEGPDPSHFPTHPSTHKPATNSLSRFIHSFLYYLPHRRRRHHHHHHLHHHHLHHHPTHQLSPLLPSQSQSTSNRSSHHLQQPPTHRRRQSHQQPRPRHLLHPITLLPAFVLGILTSFYFFQRSPTSSIGFLTHPPSSFLNYPHHPWNSFSSSYLFSNKLPPIQPDPPNPSLSHSSRPSIVQHRDHIYFPADYLNRTYPSTPSSHQYPILQLIHNASLTWNRKLSRQSTTLQQAIREYRRRYHRSPPTGFKDWYHWSVRNHVILIDEFDRINELIEPFWALPPHVLRNRSAEAGKNEAFSTFVIKDGKVQAIGPKKDELRTIDQLKLLEVIVPHLPDVNVTMSHHDGPSVFMDWKTKQAHLDHARAGTTLPNELIDKVEDDPSLWGFVGACSPDSPMRMFANGFGQDLQVKSAGPGGYIGLEHPKTMDLCQHPEWQELHGFTSWAGPRPSTLRPIFSFAQSPGFVSDILNAPLEQFDDSQKNQEQVKSWEDKTEGDRLLWRGQSTGVWFDRTTNWRKSHRVRLHRLGLAPHHPYGQQLKRTLRTPAFIERLNHPNRSESSLDHDPMMLVIEKEYSLAQLSQRFLSASFVGDLVQCTVEDGSCEAIPKEFEFSQPVDWQFQNNYKYVLDVDGNSWSGRFRRLLKSNSLVFKSTIWPEWYRDRIQAWFHYVPVRIDYEDVFDLMSFFTGPIDRSDQDHRPHHDDGFGNSFMIKNASFEHLAQRIARQGSVWADEHFRYEDLRSYVWRTYLEWARVSSDARSTMNEEG